MRLIIYISVLLYWAPVHAHTPADGDIYATFGPFAFATHARDNQFKNPLSGAVGLLAEADLDHNGGAEIGMFYLNKLFSMERDGLVITDKVQRIYITMGYRHWFGDRISAAVTFFSSYYMGDPERIRNDFGAAPAPKTSASDATEYGFDFSVQFEPWRRDRWAAVIDGRYSLSVTAKEGEDSNHYGMLVGIKYHVQGRYMAPP